MHYDHVTLVPGYLRVDLWDDASQDTVVRTIRPKSFLEIAPFFRASVIVSKNFTLGHLFELLDIGEDVPLLDIAIGDRIGPFLAEINKKRRTVSEGAKYVSLEVFREAAVGSGTDGGAEYAIRAGLRARTANGIEAVDTVPTYVLRDIPMSYAPEVEFFHGPHGARTGEGRSFEGKLSISFLELVQAVFWDLSFYGSPEERDAIRAEIEAQGGGRAGAGSLEIDDMDDAESSDSSYDPDSTLGSTASEGEYLAQRRARGGRRGEIGSVRKAVKTGNVQSSKSIAKGAVKASKAGKKAKAKKN